MKQFGTVKSIEFPFSSQGFCFVEYDSFKEAEKVLREINSQENSGLSFRAEFANEKCGARCPEPEIECPAQAESESEEEVETVHVMSVDLTRFQEEDPFEKVSFFHYDGPVIVDMDNPQMNTIKNNAAKSLGKYNESERCFEYNTDIRKYNFLSYYCCVCSLEATLTSGDEYFCSKKCADDFMNIPTMELGDYTAKDSDKVTITAVINEKVIYVKPSNADLHLILETVYRKAKSAYLTQYTPMVNDFVLIAAYDSFYRAKVLEILDDGLSFIVLLTDIGNILSVNLTDVYKMTPECKEVQRVTAKLMLKNVDVKAINMDVIDYLLDLKNHNVELTVKDIDEDGVELRGLNENSVNDKITRMANFDKVTFNLKYNDLTCADLSDGNYSAINLFVVNIIKINDDIKLACVPASFIRDFHELYRSLDLYGSKVDAKSFGVYGSYMLSLIKYNNQWHRGIVMKATGDGKPQCILFDLQVNCKVKVENIFCLPDALAMFQVMTDVYQIYGYHTDKDIKAYCDENIQENQFITASKIEQHFDVKKIHLNMPISK